MGDRSGKIEKEMEKKRKKSKNLLPKAKLHSIMTVEQKPIIEYLVRVVRDSTECLGEQVCPSGGGLALYFFERELYHG